MKIKIINALVFVIAVLVSVATFLTVLLFKNRKNVGVMKQRLKELSDREDGIRFLLHDLKTPLNAILLTTQAKDSNLENVSIKNEYIDRVRLSAQHMEWLLKTSAYNLNLDSGITMNVVEFNYREVSDCVKAITMPLAQKKRINLEFKEDNILYNRICADKNSICLCLVNLVTNAIKYTGDNGRVLVTVRQESIEGNTSYASLIYSIEDDGRGMDEKFIPKMYDLFARSEECERENTEGWGVGLTITKRIVDSMNGTIDVESVKGKGSKFTLSFEAVVHNEIDCLRTNRNSEEPLKGLNVLVAEDSVLNNEAIKEIIELAGAKCDGVLNGKRCIEKLKDNNIDYDVVLMDVNMPIMNGLTATSYIRNEITSRENIPIIAITGETSKETIESCYEVGMNGYIEKPFEENKIINEVLTLCLRD